MSKKVAINPGWEYYEKLTFAPAVRKGNMLFISGMNACRIDPDSGRSIAQGDIADQTAEIYSRMKEILEAAGASFEDVVATTDYITISENYKATAEVRRQYFGESFPASTGVIVNGLLGRGVLIEINAVAVLD
ncbi:MAG: RidA family protein [Dehalococcoidales bacterium]|jgi:2-iminobutanoate/2-iminopropanoate deaminase|nr:RidA family protein [Dehalococcoidales bacterium]